MKLLSRAVLFIVLFATTAVAIVAFRPIPVRPPEAVFPDELDLGTRDFGVEAVVRFQISNQGGTDLEASEFATSCTCAGVEVETEGKLKPLGSLRVAPGQAADLALRIAVGGKVGSSQTVSVAFVTNDPRRPSGSFRVTIPFIKGGVYTEPRVAAFGEMANGNRQPLTVRLYDNNVPDTHVMRVQSLNRDRFTAVFLPLTAGEQSARHEWAGRQIGSISITPRQNAGPLNGQVEIHFAGEGRKPERVNVVGEVVNPVIVRPSEVVFPRFANGKPVFEGSVVVSDRRGRPLRVSSVTAPAGMTARTALSAAGDVLVNVVAPPDSTGGVVLVRTKMDDGQEAEVKIPVLVSKGD